MREISTEEVARAELGDATIALDHRGAAIFDQEERTCCCALVNEYRAGGIVHRDRRTAEPPAFAPGQPREPWMRPGGWTTRLENDDARDDERSAEQLRGTEAVAENGQAEEGRQRRLHRRDDARP